MKSIAKMTWPALGLAVVGLAAVLGFQDVERDGGPRNTFTVDVAADCRTFVSGPNRADVSYVSGKIFPAGTLPSGTASNDPTQPVHGVAPIGEWTTRGQNNFPFPPDIAASYSAAPAFFATQYYILNDGRALVAEGYAYPSLEGHLAVIGGIGHFRGAAGDVESGAILGTNATGCPNFHARFHLVPGSLRGASDNSEN
jgi:hypothetical protein